VTDREPDGAGERADREAAKRRAGEAAAAEVEEGDVVGLGTGSTAAAAIRALGERVEAGLTALGVTTSHQSRATALQAGVPVVEPDQVRGVDLAIDGADHVLEDGAVLVKGGGGAHAREKVVAADAERFLVVVDETKLVEEPGEVPVEVLPAARRPVVDAVRTRGGAARLRSGSGKDGPVVTDNGNLVLDCSVPGTAREAARWLDGLPGVVEHGLFVDRADAVVVGSEDGVDWRRP
jgi:ribose 5-phosphate isomerase A